MVSEFPPTVRLNNHFQGLNRLWSISYQEEDHQPAAENRWSVTVQSNGIVYCNTHRRSKRGCYPRGLKPVGHTVKSQHSPHILSKVLGRNLTLLG
ncbi:hypothetical protein EI94DRAFT_1744303 [Lactarius quietus]|nr:hypothetical protein EI94DRAFT_1744303 [Lactarius quietus]